MHVEVKKMSELIPKQLGTGASCSFVRRGPTTGEHFQKGKKISYSFRTRDFS